MRKKVGGIKPAVVLTVAAALPLIGVGVASATPPDATRGEPSCHGLTISAYARDDGALADGAGNYGGLRRAAELRELTVQQLQQQVMMDLCMMGGMM